MGTPDPSVAGGSTSLRWRMLVCFTLITALEAASPVWLVVPADAEPPSASGARAIVTALEKTGRRASVAASDHPALRCTQLDAREQTGCFAGIASSTNVVLVSGVAIRERMALAASVLGPTGAPLEQAGDKGAASELDDIATSVIARLSATLSSREGQAAAVSAPVVVVAPEPQAPSRVPAYVGFGLAGAVGVVAIVLGVIGSGAAQRVNTLMPGQLSYSQALALEQQANGTLTGALFAGVGALVLAVASGVMWLAPP